MAVDTQMYTHIFDAVKGWFGDWVVDFQAQLAAAVTITVYQGRVVHLNNDGEWETGCVGDQMSGFVTSPSDAPSTGNPSPSGYWYAMHAETLNAVMATSGLEVETTEFDTAQTYLPNQPLRATVANTTQATGGLLTNQSVVKVASATPASATAIVGIVSKAVGKQSFDKPDVLSLWHVYQPGAAGL